MTSRDAIIGNAWHGRLGPVSLTLADDAEITSIPSGNGVTVVDYVPPAPTENLGHTYYFKTPGIGVANTPESILAAGGEFKNDAILFGDRRRYSPFCHAGMLSAHQWLHFGHDGKWRVMSLREITVSGPSSVVEIWAGDQFGVINREAPAQSVLVAQLTLTGRSCSDAMLSEIDVRHDGRQIVVCLLAKWPNAFDSGSDTPASVVFDNASVRSVAAAWRIDVAPDLLSASASTLFVAEDPVSEVAGVSPWSEPTGPVVWEDELGLRKFFQPFYARETVNGGSRFLLERLVGAGFSADGTLHLIKFKHLRERQVQWIEHFGFVSRGTALLPTNYVPPSFPGGDFVPPFQLGDPDWPYSTLMHNDPPANSSVSEVLSNSIVLTTLSGSSASALHAEAMTNNVFDLRDTAVSLARIGPGCIDNTPMSGTIYSSFDPRTGSVQTSLEQIGFV